MEFRITSTNSRRPRQAGFTLVELLVTAGLGGLAMAVFLSLSLFTARGIASMTNSVDLNARSRHAIDRMSKKLRQTSSVKSLSANSVSVVYNGIPLTYTYQSNKKTLVETEGSKITTLLRNCDDLAFSFYKRNPVTNSFNQFPIDTSPAEMKVIEVRWRCSTKLLGNAAGSADIVTAKIVVRSK